AYTGALAASALDWAWARARVLEWAAPVPALLLVIAPYFALDHSSTRKHTDANDTNFPAVLAKLNDYVPERSKASRATLFVNRRSSSLLQYYTELHPTVAPHVGKSVLKRYNVTKLPKDKEIERIDEHAPQYPTRAWFLTDQTDAALDE